MSGETPPPTSTEAGNRVERVVERSLEEIQTPEAAEAVIDRIEQQCTGKTEAERGKEAAQTTSALPGSHETAAATTIERAAEQPAPAPEDAVARTLEATAAQAVAPTPAAPAVMEGAHAALGASTPVSAPAQQGRDLLKEAALRRMPIWERLDARLYLLINNLPHTKQLDSLVWVLTQITVGGWIWVIGTLVAYLLRVPRSWDAVERLLPSVVAATWIIEYPVKAYFRRRRPFVEIVRALVIGKKPGSWSFPSGHTASSFASAWVLSTIWPRRSPVFFAIASTVGISRVYAGAHYPGDVTSGAFLGMLLAEIFRRIAARVLH